VRLPLMLPHRYRLIEDKLQLSEYLQWTFLSCTGPMKVCAAASRCVMVCLLLGMCRVA
jgi:hypothetical protein